MTKNTRLIIIVSAIVLAIVAFYGGDLYGKNSAQKAFPSGFSAGGGGRGNRTRPTGADFMSGQIIAKDDRSITLKTRDGNTKIIFYSESTDVGKFVKGATGDLSTNETVMVTGKTNPDGSLTATNIQIRPDQPAPSAAPAPAK